MTGLFGYQVSFSGKICKKNVKYATKLYFKKIYRKECKKTNNKKNKGKKCFKNATNKLLKTIKEINVKN